MIVLLDSIPHAKYKAYDKCAILIDKYYIQGNVLSILIQSKRPHTISSLLDD